MPTPVLAHTVAARLGRVQPLYSHISDAPFMFKILKQLFASSSQSQASEDLDKADSRTRSKEALQEFERQIEGLGDPEHPFLDKDYSPSSRVPCTDFVPFIAERLKAHDLESVRYVMRGVLEANPGLGVGPEWIDEKIQDVASLDFKKYVHLEDEDAYYQLKAMYIIAEKGGGGREFWLTEEFPELFSWSMCAFRPYWQDPIQDLAQRANSFIEEMAEDLAYWEDYPRLEKSEVQVDPPSKTPTQEKVKDISPAGRMHLFYAVSRGGGSLPDLTNYPIRSFGINEESTSREIIGNGLMSTAEDPSVLMGSMTKKELIEACEESGADYYKSWNKDEILDALKSDAPGYVKEKIEKIGAVTVNPNHEDKIQDLISYAGKLEESFKALFFIDK